MNENAASVFLIGKVVSSSPPPFPGLSVCECVCRQRKHLGCFRAEMKASDPFKCTGS